MPKTSLMIYTPIQTFIGLFGLEALEEYRTLSGSSFVMGKISSANDFAHECSNSFFSRKARSQKLSVRDNC